MKISNSVLRMTLSRPIKFGKVPLQIFGVEKKRGWKCPRWEATLDNGTSISGSNIDQRLYMLHLMKNGEFDQQS